MELEPEGRDGAENGRLACHALHGFMPAPRCIKLEACMVLALEQLVYLQFVASTDSVAGHTGVSLLSCYLSQD